MKPHYDIKFLSDEEFDNMPFADRLGEDVSDSLGVYNPYTGQIRVRDTGIWSFNKEILEHELEHIVEEHASDEGPNGLRHRKKKRGFVDWFTGLSTAGLWHPNASSTGSQNKEADKQQAQQNEMAQMFQSPFGNAFGPQGSTPSFGSQATGSMTGQDTQTSLNQGLNQQSINPLADPYSQYGRPSGRLFF